MFHVISFMGQCTPLRLDVTNGSCAFHERTMLPTTRFAVKIKVKRESMSGTNTIKSHHKTERESDTHTKVKMFPTNT